MPAPAIPAAAWDWADAELTAMFFAEQNEFPAFCEEFKLNPETAESHQMWTRYRMQAEAARKDWLPSLGGRL